MGQSYVAQVCPAHRGSRIALLREPGSDSAGTGFVPDNAIKVLDMRSACVSYVWCEVRGLQRAPLIEILHLEDWSSVVLRYKSATLGCVQLLERCYRSL